jgi:hypothetical protein
VDGIVARRSRPVFFLAARRANERAVSLAPSPCSQLCIREMLRLAPARCCSPHRETDRRCFEARDSWDRISLVFGAALRGISVVVFLVVAQAAQGVGAPQDHPWARPDLIVGAAAQRPDLAILTTRLPAGVSAARQSSPDRAALTIGCWAAQAPAGSLPFAPSFLNIDVRTDLPFCVCPRPPPSPLSL